MARQEMVTTAAGYARLQCHLVVTWWHFDPVEAQRHRPASVADWSDWTVEERRVGDLVQHSVDARLVLEPEIVCSTTWWWPRGGNIEFTYISTISKGEFSNNSRNLEKNIKRIVFRLLGRGRDPHDATVHLIEKKRKCTQWTMIPLTWMEFNSN